jgi:hemoglobin-like flavoprotein
MTDMTSESPEAPAGLSTATCDVVGTELLTAMDEVVGPLDDSVVAAWTEAYRFLADIFIKVEQELAAP